MKVGKLVLLTIVMAALVSPITAQDTEELKVMTWNIRLDTKDDGVNQWQFRKQGVCDEIMKQSPHVLGVQEAMNNQMVDLRNCLKGYKSLGVARDDGRKAGEFSALFYKKSELKAVRSGTFWLSETPGTAGSRGWDAACNRVVTWAEFKDKDSGKHFMVFNTHFDHMGDTARVQSAMLINRKIAELANRLPVSVTGDFNVTSKHRAYRILTYPENEYVLTDSRLKARVKSGPDVTWVSFDTAYTATDIIDFIFVSPEMEVSSNTIFDFRSSGKYLSDHLPVTASFTIK
jgi:endonuclease/exonuclease/phosphatase family metal-dependent hydrolase